MVIYSLDHPTKGLIQFKDKKRVWWAAAILFPTLPLLVIALYFQFDNPWVLLSPLVLSYVLIPIIDYLVGTDRTNPPEELVPQLNADSYYQNLLYWVIPVHFVVVIAGAWLVANEPLSLGFYVAFAYIIGTYSGFSINTAHELGHKNTKRARLLSRVILSVTGYGHFCIEHNLGHHRDVSTPEDPASARMGESIYRFALREIPGAAKRGWNEETKRLAKRGFNTWTWHNHILQSYALTVLWQGAFGGLVSINQCQLH